MSYSVEINYFMVTIYKEMWLVYMIYLTFESWTGTVVKIDIYNLKNLRGGNFQNNENNKLYFQKSSTEYA